MRQLALEQAGTAPAMNRLVAPLVDELDLVGQRAADIAYPERLGFPDLPHDLRSRAGCRGETGEENSPTPEQQDSEVHRHNQGTERNDPARGARMRLNPAIDRKVHPVRAGNSLAC